MRYQLRVSMSSLRKVCGSRFAPFKRRRDMVSGRNGGEVTQNAPPAPETLRHRKLVRRSHFLTIVAAWIITVPATALLSATVFFALSLVF